MSHALLPTEVSFKILDGSVTLRGKQWGNPNVESHKRVLAWPGWLDNCGTWDTCAPVYAEHGYCVVAIDPIGCGFSDHRKVTSYYNDFEEGHHMMEVADLMGWSEPFILLAHSKGSHIAGTVAGSFRERILAIVLHESLFATQGTYSWNYEYSSDNHQDPTPANCTFREIVEGRKKQQFRPPKKFASVEQLVKQTALNPIFPKSEGTAHNIVLRHLRELKEDEVQVVKGKALKYTFTHDTRIYGQNQPVLCFPNATLSYRKKIDCPVIVMNVKSSMYSMTEGFEEFFTKGSKMLSEQFTKNHNPAMYMKVYEDWRARMTAPRDLTYYQVEGFHHVHSDDYKTCTKLGLDFLATKGKRNIGKDLSGLAVKDLRKEVFALYRHLLLLRDDENKEQLRNLMEGEDKVFDVLGCKIGATVYGDAEAENRFLCIHDDQDNAEVFRVLASEMVASGKDCCLVAFDRPGRGSSDRRTRDQFYSAVEDTIWVADVADSMNWKNFNIICHNRGSILGGVFARWFPERVQKLIFLSAFAADVSEPLSLPDEFLPSEMNFSYYEDQRKMEPQLKVEQYFRSAMAEKLVNDRNERTNYQKDWRMDVRSPMGFSDENMERDFSKITAPCLVLNPENKQTKLFSRFLLDAATPLETKSYFSRCERELFCLRTQASVTMKRVQGSRYLFVDNAKRCSSEILSFILPTQQPSEVTRASFTYASL